MFAARKRAKLVGKPVPAMAQEVELYRVDGAQKLLTVSALERVVPIGGKDTIFHWLLVSHMLCRSGYCRVHRR